MGNTASYAKDNLPTRYKMFSNRYADYSYDSLNRLTQRVFSTETPLYNNYIYKSSGRNTESTDGKYRTTLISKELIDKDAYVYTYDELGNITSIGKGKRTAPNGGTTYNNVTAYRSYEYDALSQLTRENNATKGKTQTWNYDALGNIESSYIYNYTTSTPGQASNGIDYQYTDDSKNGWNKLLTTLIYKTYKSTGGEDTTKRVTKTIAYDAIGNPTSYLGASLTWFGRQLKTYNKNSVTTTYKYDASGLRGYKKVGSDVSTYQYENGNLLYENRDGMPIYYYYDSYGHFAGLLYYTKDTNGDDVSHLYYATTNAQGDVMGLYTSGGDLRVAYEYDAWGNQTIYTVTQNSANANVYTKYTRPATASTSVAYVNTIGYRGYYFDIESGLYYLQSRYYNPEIGRFLNSDSILASETCIGFNSFAYCYNNPIRFADSCGRLPDDKLLELAEKYNNGGYVGICGGRKNEATEDETNNQTPAFAASEHHKRGTTNKANKQRHEEGKARNQKDHRGEKGDARRTPNPNKRKIELNCDEKLLYASIAIGATAGVVYLVVNDATLVGICDDVAIAPLIPIIWEATTKVFN